MTVRLGAIGLGGLGRIELGAYADLDGVEIAAGADISADARERFEAEHGAPAYEDCEAMLERRDLDAVNVVTPHTLHYEQATACLDAGADVFLEKPMVTGTENAVDLAATAEERGRVLAVGYQRHFDPVFRELKRTVESGRIGEVHAANAALGQDWIELQRGTWRTDPELSGGGQLYDSGSHLLDALLWTLDATPRSVAAVTDARGEAVDVNSALAAVLDRERGDGGVDAVTASVGVVGDGTNGEPDESLTIWGTDGHVRYADGGLTVFEDGATYEGRVDGDRDFETLTRRKLSDFVRAVETGEPPAVPGSFGLQVTALTEAAYEAAERGRTVDVRERIERARDSRTPDLSSDD